MIRDIRSLQAAALVLAAAGIPGCSGGDTGRQQLVLTGSSTIAPLAGELAKRFEAIHPGVRVDVQSGGSSRGIADVSSGAADIGMVSRPLTAGEKRQLVPYAIARDGVAPIVHRDNRIGVLSDDRIVAVYTGRIRNWRELGGEDAPITVVNKAAGRATLAVFLSYFHLDPTAVRADVIGGENEQVIKTVAGNRHAIGYVSIGTAEVDIARGVPIRLLPVGGVAATSAHVADGSFPMWRPLNLVTRGPAKGLARRFIDFARSEAADATIREQGFAPLPR